MRLGSKDTTSNIEEMRTHMRAQTRESKEDHETRRGGREEGERRARGGREERVVQESEGEGREGGREGRKDARKVGK